MSHPDQWRGALILLLTVLAFPLLVPPAAVAAPAGKVVIAQGVDPSTLDMMNQSEQPASNVGAQMFDMLVARDQSLALVPELARAPEAGGAHDLGDQAPQGREISQR